MFLGNYITQLGSGNRVAVPKRFRTQLGETFIVAKWYEKCLVIISTESWSELLQKLTGGQSIPTAAVRDTHRFIMGSAFELTADAQGRFVIPENLKAFADLKDEVVFLGLGDRVEVWDKKEWTARESYIGEHAAALLESLADEK